MCEIKAIYFVHYTGIGFSMENGSTRSVSKVIASLRRYSSSSSSSSRLFWTVNKFSVWRFVSMKNIRSDVCRRRAERRPRSTCGSKAHKSNLGLICLWSANKNLRWIQIDCAMCSEKTLRCVNKSRHLRVDLCSREWHNLLFILLRRNHHKWNAWITSLSLK